MLRHANPWAILLLSTVYFVSPSHTFGQAKVVKKENLRYDGKSFVQWQEYLETELKPEKRVEAFKAFTEFGIRGYTKEATYAIIEGFVENEGDAKEFATNLYWFDSLNSLPAAKSKENLQVLYYAGQCIFRMGQPAVPVLVEIVKSHSNKYARQFALRMLDPELPLFSEKILPKLFEFTLDDNQEMALEARSFVNKAFAKEKVNKTSYRATLEATGKTAAVIAAAVSDLNSKKSQDILEALRLLQNLGPLAKPAIPTLVESLRNKDYYIQKTAWNALKETKAEPKILVSALTQLLKESLKNSPKTNETVYDDTEKNRILIALDGLTEFSKEAGEAVPELLSALKIESEGLRSKAFRLIGTLGPNAKAAIPTLLEVLKAEPPDLQDCYESIQAMKLIGVTAKQLFPYLHHLLKNQVSLTGGFSISKSVSGWISFGPYLLDEVVACGALAKEAVPTLIQQFSKARLYCSDKAQIATTLGKMGPLAKEAVPLLKAALHTDHDELRQAAKTAIQQITGESKPKQEQ